MEELPVAGAVVFDGFLALVLLILAWQILCSKGLFKAVVLFISFGLLMSLAWVRLRAVDIALAEAAIGAGLTGALLLSALNKLVHTKDESRQPSDKRRPVRDGEPI